MDDRRDAEIRGRSVGKTAGAMQIANCAPSAHDLQTFRFFGEMSVLLYKENPVLDTGFVEAMRLNNNFPTVKLKLRSGNCNKV